ncbi:MAG: rhomboid family intramembrane serine protease [Phycisphaerae bacterium]|jgi:membrane associated rhomboid family serine protease|nr:rhomboid family intramembrane serine protease [Phycisphaerae bacterium]
MDAVERHTDPPNDAIACLIRIQQVMLAKGYIYIAGDRKAWPDTPVQMTKEQATILVVPYYAGTVEEVLNAWNHDKESTGLLLVGEVETQAREIDRLLAHKRYTGSRLAYIDAVRREFRTQVRFGSLTNPGKEALDAKHIEAYLDPSKFKSSRGIDCTPRLAEHIAQKYQRELFEEAMLEAAGTKWPVFTLVVTATMAAMWIMVFNAAGCHLMHDIGDPELMRFGALHGPLARDGQQWRMLSYSILHRSASHFAFSIIVVAVSGWWLEMHQGAWRALVSFVAGAFGAAIGSLWIAPEAIIVSSAGGMLGMAGAIVAVQMRFWGQFPKGHWKATAAVLLSILPPGFLAVALGNMGFIAGLSLAIGGFVGGLAFGFVVARPPTNRSKPRRWIWPALLGLVALSLILANHAINRIPQTKTPQTDETVASITRK